MSEQNDETKVSGEPIDGSGETPSTESSVDGETKAFDFHDGDNVDEIVFSDVPSDPEELSSDLPDVDASECGPESFEDAVSKAPNKKAKIVVGAIAAVVILFIVAAMLPCNHEWQEATCTEPKVCTKCGETEGEALGHDWQEATCSTPKTCLRCGETEGSALGHDVVEWITTKEATCAEAGEQTGVCTRCGETQTKTIAKVAHTEGEWETTKQPSVTSTGSVTPGQKELKCSVCGETIKIESVTLEVTTSQVNALRKASSYLSFTAFSHSGLVDQLEFEGFSNEDATFAADYCGADWNEQAAKKAQSYLSFTAFSHSGLVDQLEFEGFTSEQAEYGANAVGL